MARIPLVSDTPRPLPVRPVLAAKPTSGRAAQMDVKPWYTELQAAPVRLTIEDDSSEQAKIYEGAGIVEFMDFHLNPE